MNKEEKDIGKIMEEMLNRPLDLIEENKKLKKKIDKLQKENKNLKEKYKNINWYYENQKDNFVHKDKIRAKIKELEEKDKMFKLDLPEDATIYQFTIEILEELLEMIK